MFLNLLMSFLLFAELDLNQLDPAQALTYTTEAGVSELCLIPQRLDLRDYTNGDLEDEQELCSMDFYNRGPKEAVICPKISSTNPGIEVYSDADSATLNLFKAEQCSIPSKERDRTNVERIAKYKQSVSCSYTPSILAYYHISRALGDVANIPVAVLRTMSVEEHKKISELALNNIPANHDLLRQTWQTISGVTRNPHNDSSRVIRKYRPMLFTSDYQQIYGALLMNTKGESSYREFWFGDYAKLEAKPLFQAIANSSSVFSIAQSQAGNEGFQLLAAAKDMVDMLVLDFLLNQQDRMRNIEQKEYYYQVQEDGSIKEKRIKSSTVVPSDAYRAKRLVLTDNDCGVKKDNRTKKSGIMQKIRNISLTTYLRVQSLYRQDQAGELEPFFKTQLHFTDDDYNSNRDGFKTNLKLLAEGLKQACKSGLLNLSLNPENYILGKADVNSQAYCDLSAANL